MKRYLTIIVSLVVGLSAYALSYNTGTITTPKGSTIEVLFFTESASERSALDSDARVYITENYPNATIIGDATYTYNCHGYAWSKSEGGYTCWINAYKSDGNENLSKYWTDGSFSASSEAYALKIHYPNGDHSAIRTYQYPGKYVSKWGNGSLVVHDAGYGPYVNMSNRNYYRVYQGITHGLLSCNNGQGTIGVGVSSGYGNSTFTSGQGRSFEWVIWDAKGDDAIENGKASISIGSIPYDATITFNKTGIYEIYLNVYDFTGYQIGEFWFEGIVVN